MKTKNTLYRIFFFISLLFALVPASAQKIENIKNLPVDAVFYNECCNERVHIVGMAHLLVTRNIIHVSIKNTTGTGMSSGYSYIGVGTAIETNVFYSNQFEGTLISKLNMKNGNGCSFKLKILMHITLNANGNLTAIIERFETDCD